MNRPPLPSNPQRLRVLLTHPAPHAALETLAQIPVLEPHVCRSLDAVEARLRETDCDVLFVDLDTACRSLAEFRDRVPHLPCIVLADARDEGQALQLLPATADDYLLTEQLTAEAVARTIRQVRQLHLARRQLADQVRRVRRLQKRAATHEHAIETLEHVARRVTKRLLRSADVACSGPAREGADFLASAADLAALSRGCMPPIRRLQQLRGCADAVLRRCHRLADLHDCALEFDIVETDTPLHVDGDQITRVWSDLVMRAVRANPNGKVRVWAREERREAAVICGVTPAGGIASDATRARPAERFPRIAAEDGAQAGDEQALRSCVASRLIEANLGRWQPSNNGDPHEVAFMAPTAEPRRQFERFLQFVRRSDAPGTQVSLMQIRCEPGTAEPETAAASLQAELEMPHLLFPLDRSQWLLAAAEDASVVDQSVRRWRAAEPAAQTTQLCLVGGWCMETQPHELRAFVETMIELSNLTTDTHPRLLLVHRAGAAAERMSALLEAVGYEVTSVPDQQEAVDDALQTCHPSAVVYGSDIAPPRRGEWQHRAHSIPVVLLSAQIRNLQESLEQSLDLLSRSEPSTVAPHEHQPHTKSLVRES